MATTNTVLPDKELGIITAWIGKYGFIRSTRPGFATDFFLHVSRVVSGIPRQGAKVEFRVLPKSETEKHATAYDAEIIDAAVGKGGAL